MGRILGENEFTEEEYNKLKRKIDWILLPLVSPSLTFSPTV